MTFQFPTYFIKIFCGDGTHFFNPTHYIALLHTIVAHYIAHILMKMFIVIKIQKGTSSNNSDKPTDLIDAMGLKTLED